MEKTKDFLSIASSYGGADVLESYNLRVLRTCKRNEENWLSILHAVGDQDLGLSETEKLIVLRCSSGFMAECSLVSIYIARIFLEVVRAASTYASPGILANEKGYSELARDDFDARIAGFLDQEQQNIERLQLNVKAMDIDVPSDSLLAHRQSVLQALSESKRKATSVLGELQILRARRTLSLRPVLFSKETDREVDDEIERLVAQDMSQDSFAVEEQQKKKQISVSKTEDVHSEDSTETQNVPTVDATVTENGWSFDELDSDPSIDDPEPKLEKALAQEQNLLSSHLQEELKEVRTAERQMEEFSELVEIFSSKLAEQHDSIFDLETDLDTSTGCMEKAEKELVQAKQHNKSFRIYVITFFIVLIFSLLFMDYLD